jgi:signal transduction histidine kinase
MSSRLLIKTKCIMNISHDFRTPVSGIYNMACSLNKRIDDPEMKHHMQLIVDSSSELIKSLDDILDYSRLKSGQYFVDKEECRINSLINEVVTVLLPKITDKGIKLDIIQHTDNDLIVNERMIIHRILLNILGNAIKYTDVGVIEIKSFTERYHHKNWLIIAVSDTGIGIDTSHLPLIFEPFYRVGSEDTSKNFGIGLGLSNVKAMLEIIGGKVDVYSYPGKGSVFTVHLPLSNR